MKLCFKCRIGRGDRPKDDGAHTAQITTCEGCQELRAILPDRHWVTAPKSIICPKCERETFNKTDVEEKFCVVCGYHEFFEGIEK